MEFRIHLNQVEEPIIAPRIYPCVSPRLTLYSQGPVLLDFPLMLAVPVDAKP